jgi:uncharacterized protein YjiS (DUF1127 family)
VTTTHAIVSLTPSLASRAPGSWRKRVRQRRKLLGLPDSVLKDIGTSRRDAWCEARKPFREPWAAGRAGRPGRPSNHVRRGPAATPDRATPGRPRTLHNADLR